MARMIYWMQTYGPSYSATRRLARSSALSCRKTTGQPSISSRRPGCGCRVDEAKENMSRKHTEWRASCDMCTRNNVSSARQTTLPSSNHKSVCRYSSAPVSGSTIFALAPVRQSLPETPGNGHTLTTMKRRRRDPTCSLAARCLSW